MARKTYEINDELLADLEPMEASLGLSETDLVHIALTALLQSWRRGIPIYLTDPPEGDPPTSGPSAASLKALRVVGNQTKGGTHTPATRPLNTKRRKK